MIRNSFILLLGTLALSCLLAVSCEKDEAEEPENGTNETTEKTVSPAIGVSTAAIAASSDGGSYKFNCTVTNSTDDGQIVCTTDEIWICGLGLSGSRTVSFTVEANTSEQTRDGNIIVSYVWSGGSVEELVTVAQNSASAVEISVESVSLIASKDGGAYQLSYSVKNGTDDGALSCETGDSWLNGFDLSKDGVLAFNIDENPDSDLRTGELVLTYANANGSVSRTVAVIQDHERSADYSSLFGTYEASALAFYRAHEVVEKTWALRIFPDSGENVRIDGLVPYAEDSYPLSESYIAHAYLDSEGDFIVPAQLTGGVDWYLFGYYVGYALCTGFVEGDDGGYRLSFSGNCTFTRGDADGIWVSDYGFDLGLYTSRAISASYYYNFYDTVVPPITIRKVSDSIGATI